MVAKTSLSRFALASESRATLREIGKPQMAEIALTGQHHGREFAQRTHPTNSAIEHGDHMFIGLARLVVTITIKRISCPINNGPWKQV